MSEIKVNSIKGVSASSAAISVDNSSGSATANLTTVNSVTMPNGGFLSNRNKIINGSMLCSQRGQTFTSPSNTDCTLDRFRINHSMGGAITVTQSTTSPDGFSRSLKVDVTTADTIGAGEYLQINHKVEARDLQDLAFGTSSAKNFTFSFYVRSNVTGTYTTSIQLPDDSAKQVSQTYTINSADTWERKSFTFTGDTSGVINNDNGNGMNIYWQLAIGSNYTGGSSSTTFQANSDPNFAAGHTANLLSSTSNEFYLTGVQLEVGSVATDFEHRSFAQELALCQRYYFIQMSSKHNSSSDYEIEFITANMRATPTATRLSNVYFGGESSTSFSSIETNTTNQSSEVVTMVYVLRNTSDANCGGKYAFDAEL